LLELPWVEIGDFLLLWPLAYFTPCHIVELHNSNQLAVSFEANQFECLFSKEIVTFDLWQSSVPD